MKKLTLFVLCLLASFSANAATDYNRAITSIGAQNTIAYINLTPAPSTTCLYNLVYISDTSTSSGKALYATLLTAYAQGKPLQRVDYAVQPSGQCWISLIQVGS